MKLCNANFANPFLAILLRLGVALLSRIQALLTTLSLLYPIILCKFKKKISLLLLIYYSDLSTQVNKSANRRT